MKENRRLLSIICILLLCCFVCICYLLFHKENTSNMIIKQVDLNDTETEMFTLFDRGCTDLFEFNVDIAKVNTMVVSFERLVNGGWETVSSFSDDVDSSYNRLLIDFEYEKGGRVAHQSFGKEVKYDVTSSTMTFPDDYEVIKKDGSNDVVVSSPFNKEKLIVNNEHIILQAYYIGNSDEELSDLFDYYDKPEKFSNFKNVLIVTVTFSNK